MDSRRNAPVALLAYLAPNVPKALGVVGWLSSNSAVFWNVANCCEFFVREMRNFWNFVRLVYFSCFLKTRWIGVSCFVFQEEVHWVFFFFKPRKTPGEATRWMAILVNHASLNCKFCGFGALDFSKNRKNPSDDGTVQNWYWNAIIYIGIYTYVYIYISTHIEINLYTHISYKFVL